MALMMSSSPDVTPRRVGAVHVVRHVLHDTNPKYLPAGKAAAGDPPNARSESGRSQLAGVSR